MQPHRAASKTLDSVSLSFIESCSVKLLSPVPAVRVSSHTLYDPILLVAVVYSVAVAPQP